MNEDCQNDDVLTLDMLRKALAWDRFPQKHYYPMHSAIWDSFLELGWTEKQLTDYGFVKTTYIK